MALDYRRATPMGIPAAPTEVARNVVRPIVERADAMRADREVTLSRCLSQLPREGFGPVHAAHRTATVAA